MPKAIFYLLEEDYRDLRFRVWGGLGPERWSWCLGSKVFRVWFCFRDLGFGIKCFEGWG